MLNKKMLNQILLLSLLSALLNISLYADNILTNYRNNGLDDIEKKMDSELTKTEYWDNYLKDKDTKFGYIESYASVLTCNKKESSLHLYNKDNNNSFTLEKNYSAFTGEVKGDKIKEGDLKTPIGIYNITKKISKLDSFYGPLALVTSYPNLYDKYRGKTGSGIWIHGLPTQQKRDDFTRGCIAINNENIQCLDRSMDIEKTILIISESTTKQNISKEILSKLLAGLYEWRYSWLYNETQKYLSFYSSDFIRSNGMKYEQFKKYKTRIFDKAEKKKIIFNNINVIPYPNAENTFKITFKQYYTSKSFYFEGDKILMVRVDSDNNFKIFTEK